MRRNKMNQLNSQAIHSSTAYQQGYQRALSDFGIIELLAKLRDLKPGRDVGEQDQERLIALLIQQLTNNLNSKLLDNYFQALEFDFFEVLLKEIQPPSKELPIHFKENAIPCYHDGEILRWIPAKGGVDWGIAIGRFYAYAPHLSLGPGNTLSCLIRTRPVPLG